MGIVASTVGFIAIHQVIKLLLNNENLAHFQQKLNMDANSEKLSKFELVHAIKGRRRYRSDLLKDQKFAEDLKRKFDNISEFAFINKIKINNVTGSILLEYLSNDSNEKYIDDLFSGLNQNIEKLESGKELEAKKRSTISKRLTYLNFVMKKSLNKLNSSVANSTYNILDLKTFVGLLFFGLGGYRVLTLKEFPAGPQMMWWGYHILNIDK